MRYAILVDSSCDLPQAFLRANPVTVLPATVHTDAGTVRDGGEPAPRINWWRAAPARKRAAPRIETASSAELRALVGEELASEHDCVFCLTPAGTRHPLHARALEASADLVRADVGLHGAGTPFLMPVIDTQSLFAGQAVLAIEAAHMARAGASPGRIRERLESLANHTWTWILPRDAGALHPQLRRDLADAPGRLRRSVGQAFDMKTVILCRRGALRVAYRARGFNAAAAALLAYVTQRVRSRLLTRALCLSYGGDPATLTALPGYAELAAICREHRIGLYAAMMSVPGMALAGTGALSIGFADEPHVPALGNN